MACDRTLPLVLTSPLVVLAALTADEAAAAADVAASYGGYCPYGDAGYDPAPQPTGGIYDYCGGVLHLDNLAPRTLDAIPIDGVLVLQATGGGVWDPNTALDHIALEVTLAAVPVPGTLAATDVPNLLTWRPDDPWMADTTYQVGGTLSNPGVPAQCADESIPFAFDIAVGSEPADALVPSTLTGTEQLVETPLISLESLACCPGVSPTVNNSNCGGSTINFDPAQCTPIVAVGALQVDMTGTPSATGPSASVSP